ncbi:MAG: helix-turn-helix domain-containing protein [Halanaeroarchaeum sp.]
MGSSASRLQTRAAATGPLDVRLSVDPDADCVCPLTSCSAISARQSVSGEDSGSTCRLVIDSGQGAEYETVEICEACPCPVFDRHDCVHELRDVRDDSLLFSVTIPDRTHLAPLIDDLRDTDATVSVNRILTSGGDEEAEPGLTDKQREAFLIAVEEGYYDRPRGATLDDIAEELEITSSAVSQRLTAVKRRLVRLYAQRYDDKLSR